MQGRKLCLHKPLIWKLDFSGNTRNKTSPSKPTVQLQQSELKPRLCWDFPALHSFPGGFSGHFVLWPAVLGLALAKSPGHPPELFTHYLLPEQALQPSPAGPSPGIPPCCLPRMQERGGASSSSLLFSPPSPSSNPGWSPGTAQQSHDWSWHLLAFQHSPGSGVTSPAPPFIRTFLGQGCFSLLRFSKPPHQSQPVGSSVSFIYPTMVLLNHTNLCSFSPFFPFFLYYYFLNNLFILGELIRKSGCWGKEISSIAFL